MSKSITTYVIVTAAMVTIPASANGDHPPGRHLVGLALFVAQQLDRERWRFFRHARIISAGEPEASLLEWAADRLPNDAILIGWNVDHGLIPLLLDAAETAPPAVAHHFIGRLHRLLRGGIVDISLSHGGAGAPALAAVAEDMAIRSPKMESGAVLGAWATGQTMPLRHDLADEAVAIWRVFIRSAGAGGIGAEAATDEWARQRRRLRLVKRADSAA